MHPHPSLWYITFGPKYICTKLSPGSRASGLVLSWSGEGASAADCFIASSFLFSLPSHHLPTLSSHPIRHHSLLSLSLPPIFAYHTRYRSRGDQRGAFAFVVRSSFRGRENPSRATQFREGVHHVDFAHFNFSIFSFMQGALWWKM